MGEQLVCRRTQDVPVKGRALWGKCCQQHTYCLRDSALKRHFRTLRVLSPFTAHGSAETAVANTTPWPGSPYTTLNFKWSVSSSMQTIILEALPF